LKLKCTHTGKSKKHSHPTAADVYFHPAATHPTAETKTKTKTEAEAKPFNKYFTPPQIPNITTTLLIPLTLMPTTCLLLMQTFTYNQHPLVLLLELSALHINIE